MAEIQAETSAVAQFLIDREIEAPERYSAVQSYRVAMAVLRQQRLFVEVRRMRQMWCAVCMAASRREAASVPQRGAELSPGHGRTAAAAVVGGGKGRASHYATCAVCYVCWVEKTESCRGAAAVLSAPVLPRISSC
jgi:hypothetical protein